MANGDDTLRARVERYSAAQRRTAAIALDLFGERGVAGTSLQMIADRLGVTKAAVYHQFHSKDDIVIAVLELELAPVEEALDRSTSTGPTVESRRTLLAEMIDGVVARRRVWRTLQSDPAFLRALDVHAPSRHLWARLFDVLVGDISEPQERVRAAVLSATIGAVGHPFVSELDDTTLAALLLDAAWAQVDPLGGTTPPPERPDR